MNSGLSLAARALLGAAVCTGTAVCLGAEQAIAAPVAIAPYTLTTFNGVAPAGATKPDDLAISADGKNLWVGYGNNVASDGSGGSSSLIEYDISTGAVLKNISIPGHMDGLKINPFTGDIWATENEDGNPTLAIVDEDTGAFKISPFRRARSPAGSTIWSLARVRETYSLSLHLKPTLRRR